MIDRAFELTVARERTIVTDVRAGLLRERDKELPPKYFYDRVGSELFEDITALPEYYLTRAERGLLRDHARREIAATGARALVELGAGSADKTRLLIEALHHDDAPLMYLPVDLSEDFLRGTAERLERAYAGLVVRPLVDDVTRPVRLPSGVPAPTLFAFLGSTIGNFDVESALGILRGVRDAMRPADAFLLGADLHKDRAVLERAYNDAAGVTAEFNRNMLRVLNRELGADFPVEHFEHVAFYNDEEHQIEMHLKSSVERTVLIPEVGPVTFRQGETIRTEISRKYDVDSLCRLLRDARLRIEQWMVDHAHAYALVLARPF
jgi:L-histidine N-alpha-methyltransferase